MTRNELILRNRPWRSEAAIPPELLTLKGFLSSEERRLCYWLGRNWLSGRGRAVDVGAYLGAASACIAAGAEAAGLGSGNDRLVHAFDRFEAKEQYIVDALTRDARPTELGDSFLDLFESQISPYASNITAHAGEFLDQRWTSETIEVLLIDLATSPELNAHVVRQFFPSLVPGRSVVIYKTYHHCWHPYVQAGMEYLADAFELVDSHIPHQGRAWRLVKPLSGEKIARLGGKGLQAEERLALLDRLIARSEQADRPFLETVRVWQISLDGDTDLARNELARLQQLYGFEQRHEFWAAQAREIGAYLPKVA